MNKYKPIPEKAFKYKDYSCVVMFMPQTAVRCGYVGGVDYNVDVNSIDCHGNITYDSDRLPDGTQAGKRWIGFDCDNDGDMPDLRELKKYVTKEDYIRMCLQYNNRSALYNNCEIRSTEYCEEECKHIVDQLV